MAKNELYIAVGEEATRGTAESSTVGFIPVNNGVIPTLEPQDEPRREFRGEESALGDRLTRRFSTRWSYAPEIPFFTDAGTTASMMGTMIKHFFGIVASGQNGATGQYYHMMYPVSDPTATANLGTKGLTVNANYNAFVITGSAVRNNAFQGGLVSGLTFTQEPGQPLIMGMSMMGQSKVADAAEVGGETYADENLRCDYNNLTLSFGGSPTRTGTPPDYTELAANDAVQLKPDRLVISLENGKEDKLRLGGVTYPDKQTLGRFSGTLEMTIDLEDPASGFSSYDELKTWMEWSGDLGSTTNFIAVWDTGTVAGVAGDNYSLILDMPRCQRQPMDPAWDQERDPLVTLTYSLEYDTTTKYLLGLMLKNESAAV